MLCSKEFQKELEKVHLKYSDVLRALENYKATGKPLKIAAKKRFNFTIDEDIMKKFRMHCYKNNMKMSSVVEDMIAQKVNQP